MKRVKFILTIITFIILANSLMLSVHAAVDSTLSSQELIGNQLGINPHSIPQSPQEIQDKYLTKEWSKIVEKTPIIGPIHVFLSTNVYALGVEYFFLNEPYTFTLTFIMIFIFWLFVITGFTDIVRSIDLPRLNKGIWLFLLGLSAAVIVAHTGILRIVTVAIINLATKQENIWWRIIIWIIVICGIIGLYYLKEMIAAYLRKAREEDKRSKLETRVEELEEERKGRIQGRKASKL